MSVHLRTPRLVLRQFTTDDVDSLVALDSDPEVLRYLTGCVPPARRRCETRSCRGCSTDTLDRVERAASR